MIQTKIEHDVGADGIRTFLSPEGKDSVEDLNAAFEKVKELYKRFRKKVVQKTYTVGSKTIKAEWRLVVPIRDDMEFNAYCYASYEVGFNSIPTAIQAVDDLRKLGLEKVD